MDQSLRWDESCSVNIAELDHQHQRLFRTVDELEYAIREGRADSIVDQVLDKVVLHTIEHFATEEALMEEHAFPGLAEHRFEHSVLTQQLTQFDLSHRAGRPNIPSALLDFLQSWLRNHILKSDKQYSDFLNARGVF
jgi:hemerythrin